jgi:heme/copper-type cytochrome/quinol oxidase subunit 2
MNKQQAAADERDNRRVFVWGVVAVVVLVVGALLSFYLLDRRGEGPSNPGSSGQQSPAGSSAPPRSKPLA